MKRFFLQILHFTIIFVLINIIYLSVIALTDHEFGKRIESLRFKNPDYELLVLGNSLAFDGIDTEFLTSNRIKSYNLALGGSSIKTSYIQLYEYLEKYSIKPHYVILGLGSYMGIDNSEIIHPIVEITMKTHKPSASDLPILKFKWLGVELLKKIVSSKHRKAKVVDGQLKFQKTVVDNTNFTNTYLNLHKFELSNWIGKIAELCSENNIEFIIIEMPGFKNVQNVTKIGPHIIHFTDGYESSLYNLNSKDYCAIFNSERDWIGNSHLNEFGARKFTVEMLKYIHFYPRESCLQPDLIEFFVK